MGFDARAIHEGKLHLAGSGRLGQEHPCGTEDAERRIMDIVEQWSKR